MPGITSAHTCICTSSKHDAEAEACQSSVCGAHANARRMMRGRHTSLRENPIAEMQPCARESAEQRRCTRRAISLQRDRNNLLFLSGACTIDIVFLSARYRHLIAVLRGYCLSPVPPSPPEGCIENTRQQQVGQTRQTRAPHRQRTQPRAQSLRRGWMAGPVACHCETGARRCRCGTIEALPLMPPRDAAPSPHTYRGMGPRCGVMRSERSNITSSM
jgi:hypothetical protein